MEMTDDLLEYWKFYKIETDKEPGIEFISLRRKKDGQILDGNFTNTVEEENAWKLLVEKWMPSMKKMLCNYTLRAKIFGESRESLEEYEEQTPEVIFSPTNLIFAVKDKIIERSDRVLSRENISISESINPEVIKKEEKICPTLETLKQRFIDSVEKEMKEARKEGYAYDEEKIQSEINENLEELDVDDMVHKELEKKWTREKEKTLKKITL
jgi:hypothetical protein